MESSLMQITFHGAAPGALNRHFRRFRSEHVLERLREIDLQAREKGLASLDPSSDLLIRIGTESNPSGRVTKNCYGFLNLAWRAQQNPDWPSRILAEVKGLRAGLQAAHGTRLRAVIWAGMGGSMEDKTMYKAAGLLRGIHFYSLDSTDPGKLKFILEDLKRCSRRPLADVLRSTLVVGMAMGMTSYEPVMNLEKLAALYTKHGIDSRTNFIYLTLPGSLLDAFAGPRGYRRVELQMDGQNATSGRHNSPLTRGSIYPLALAGVDVKDWIQGTFLKEREIHAAWKLSAFIHAQSESGRDKVTLLVPKRLSALALWTKQDFEESLGKSETVGVKIVIGEKFRLSNYRDVDAPRQDRAFLALQVKGEDPARGVAELRRAGYPVAVVELADGAPLSRYMQFIHYAVLGLGYLREMNFVTQPAVDLYKSIAHELYSEARKVGGIQATGAWRRMTGSAAQVSWRGAVTLYYDGLDRDISPEDASEMDAPALYAKLLRGLTDSRDVEYNVEYGELTFFGDTRYSPRGRAMLRMLEGTGRDVFLGGLKIPVDVYEGPAMNHSYHEMIIGHGKCFSTIIASVKQERMPAVDYQPDYHMAQFLATKLALEKRGRPVVALMVRDLSEKSLRILRDFFMTVRGSFKKAKSEC